MKDPAHSENPKARYLQPDPEDSSVLHCSLCCHQCRIPPGKTGICGVRENRGGQPFLPLYGYVTAANSDPVEKKPLYHFLPGTKTFSLGFAGCSYQCPFCQNWQISQISEDPRGHFLSPEKAAALAEESGCRSIAFTYSEPTIHFEYLLETAALARRRGLQTILVTNGNLREEPARELLDRIDGVNVDLKSFSPDYYRRVLKGDLETVKRFIEISGDTAHTEATTLIVPGDNDDPEELEQMFEFLAGVNPRMALHLSAYRPSWHYSRPGTRDSVLEEAVAAAEKRLSYVYPGNSQLLRDTRCPACGDILIRRSGMGVREIRLADRSCPSCGRPFDGVA